MELSYANGMRKGFYDEREVWTVFAEFRDSDLDLELSDLLLGDFYTCLQSLNNTKTLRPDADDYPFDSLMVDNVSLSRCMVAISHDYPVVGGDALGEPTDWCHDDRRPELVALIKKYGGVYAPIYWDHQLEKSQLTVSTRSSLAGTLRRWDLFVLGRKPKARRRGQGNWQHRFMLSTIKTYNWQLGYALHYSLNVLGIRNEIATSTSGLNAAVELTGRLLPLVHRLLGPSGHRTSAWESLLLAYAMDRRRAQKLLCQWPQLLQWLEQELRSKPGRRVAAAAKKFLKNPETTDKFEHECSYPGTNWVCQHRRWKQPLFSTGAQSE